MTERQVVLTETDLAEPLPPLLIAILYSVNCRLLVGTWEWFE
jgi:hypothetical protein